MMDLNGKRLKNLALIILFFCSLNYSFGQEIEVFQADTLGFSDLQDYVIDNKTQVIRNERQYNGIIEGTKGTSNNQFLKRHIDFNIHDLVGYRMQYGCCKKQRISNEITLFKNGKTKCNLVIEPRAACRGLCRYTYWFIVPKLKSRFHLSINTN